MTDGRQARYSAAKLTHQPSREVTPALIYALNHPLRRQILRLLVDKATTRSPSEMAQPLAGAYHPEAYLPVLSFHARILCKQKVIRCLATRTVRGSTEHFYASNVSSNEMVRRILQSTVGDDMRFLRIAPPKNQTD